MRALLLSVLLFTGLSSHAAVPADFNREVWNQMLVKTAQEGQTLETQHGIRKFMSHIMPVDPEAAHLADYFSAVGGYDGNGQFQVDHIETVSENWRIDADGNWDIDQWLFLVSATGDLRRTMHHRLIETKDRIVVSMEIFKTQPDEELAAWDQRLNDWGARLVKPAASLLP